VSHRYCRLVVDLPQHRAGIADTNADFARAVQRDPFTGLKYPVNLPIAVDDGSDPDRPLCVQVHANRCG
jgi:hypothetical protein